MLQKKTLRHLSSTYRKKERSVISRVDQFVSALFFFFRPASPPRRPPSRRDPQGRRFDWDTRKWIKWCFRSFYREPKKLFLRRTHGHALYEKCGPFWWVVQPICFRYLGRYEGSLFPGRIPGLSSRKPGHTTSGSGRSARRSNGASGRTGCQHNFSPRGQGFLVLSKAS